MKTDGRILLFLLLLAAFLLTPGMLSAQRRGSGKREEIRIPPQALEPAWTKEYFDDNLKNFKVWLESLAQLPPTGAELKSRAGDFKELSASSVQVHLAGMQNLAANPDLEEVTRLPRSWYARIYNAALPLQTLVETLNSVKVFGSSQNYASTKGAWEKAVAEALELLGKPPKKLSREELEVIKAQNRERRKKEYIKSYRAKQAEERKKAREGAAGKKKSEKPRTDE